MCWSLSLGSPGSSGGCGTIAMTKAKVAAAQNSSRRAGVAIIRPD